VNPKKHPTELAPSTFARQRKSGQLPWSKLFAESVQELKNPALSDKAKVTWILLQPILNRSERPGYLVEGGKPISFQSLAQQLWRTESDLTQGVKELLECGMLKKDRRTFYDPMMVIDKAASESNVSKSELSPNGDGSLEEISSQVSPSRVEKSREDDIRVFSATTDRGNISASPSGGVNDSARDKTATNAVPDEISGAISSEQLNELRVKYPTKNVVGTITKCVRYYANKELGVPPLSKFEEWIERERAPKPPRERKAREHARDDIKNDVGKWHELASKAHDRIADTLKRFVFMPEDWLEDRLTMLGVVPDYLWDVIEIAYARGTLIKIQGEKCMGADFCNSVEKTRMMPKLATGSEVRDWIDRHCATGPFGPTGGDCVEGAAVALGYIIRLDGGSYSEGVRSTNCEQQVAA
jgi:hypothetical protein